MIGEACCVRLRDAVEDVNSPISYNPRFREFGIKVVGRESVADLMLFCPFCGTQLPPSLRDAWFEEMRAMFGKGFDPMTDDIPAKFMSNKWWRST